MPCRRLWVLCHSHTCTPCLTCADISFAAALQRHWRPLCTAQNTGRHEKHSPQYWLCRALQASLMGMEATWQLTT